MKPQIEAMIEKQGEGYCWIWLGDFHKKWKKPFFRGEKKRKLWVHRMIYQETFGEIPKGGMVFRICWNDLCVNPDHMRLVMPGDTQPTRIKVPELHSPPSKELEAGYRRGMGLA